MRGSPLSKLTRTALTFVSAERRAGHSYPGRRAERDGVGPLPQSVVTRGVGEVAQAVGRYAGRQQLVRDGRRRMAQEDDDVVVIAKVASGGEGADIDRIQAMDPTEVEYQPQRPIPADGLHCRREDSSSRRNS